MQIRQASLALPTAAAQVTKDGRYLLISVSDGCLPANKLWCGVGGCMGGALHAAGLNTRPA